MSRVQKASTHASMAGPEGSGARKNSGSPPCSIRRRRSTTPNSFRSYIVIGVSHTLPTRPAALAGLLDGGQVGPAMLPVVAALLDVAETGRLDVVRILASGSLVTANSRSSRVFSRRSIWSRTTVRLGPVPATVAT